MKRKLSSHKKVELNMTSMIDVVFLLLIFFVMTFKIIVPEGDFNIKMPPISAPQESVDLPPEPIRIRLSASPSGKLTTISVGDRVLGTNFTELRKRVLQMTQQRGGPNKADVEVELAPDNKLRYEYVIEAITAVTGEVRNGQVYKICDKIKFAPRRGGG